MAFGVGPIFFQKMMISCSNEEHHTKEASREAKKSSKHGRVWLPDRTTRILTSTFLNLTDRSDLLGSDRIGCGLFYSFGTSRRWRDQLTTWKLGSLGSIASFAEELNPQRPKIHWANEQEEHARSVQKE